MSDDTQTQDNAPRYPEDETSAIRGIMFAIPISLVLWGVIGMAVWAVFFRG